MPPLAKNLFTTFIIATALAIGANCAYYIYLMRGNPIDYGSVTTKIAGATLLLTVILSVMSLPVLFLVNVNYWDNQSLRLALYFSGPVVFLIASLTLKAHTSDQIFDLITGSIFLLIHSIYFIFLIRNKNTIARK
jgi:hypothetical protein